MLSSLILGLLFFTSKKLMIENPPLPNKGFVDPHVAFCIGVIGGIGSYASAKTIKKILNIDDVLDVTSLQVPT